MLKNQICPQCEEPFELTWQTEYIDGKFIHPTIVIRICLYGIMYLLDALIVEELE